MLNVVRLGVVLVALLSGTQDQAERPARDVRAPREPAAPTDADLARWGRDLGSQEFRVRQRASRSLLASGARALPHLAVA
ncbi:MAG: hypothetical protein ACC628_09795, partial [Pirellulaceae bacterium]